MFNENEFRKLIAKKGLTLQNVADMLGINIATLYRKMNGTSDFYRNEMDILVRELKISNPNDRFFS